MLSKLREKYVFYILEPVVCYYNSLKEYNHLKTLIESFKPKEVLNKTIVFNIVRPLKEILDMELFLGLILALHGAKVIVLLDDGVLPHWDTKYYVNDLPKHRKIRSNPYNLYNFNFFDVKNYIREYLGGNYSGKRILKRALKVYHHKNIEYIYYSKIIDKKNVNYHDWKELRNDAESSTIKFFRTDPLDYNNPDIKFFYNLSLLNSLLVRNVGEYVLNELKPDFYICEHGIYSTWAPAYKFLKKNGVNCYVWAGAKMHTKDITNTSLADVPNQALTTSKIWKEFQKKELTEEMRKKVGKFMENRLTGKVVDLLAYMGNERSLITVDKDDGYKYHVAMFPNLIWDGNLREKHTVFDGYMDWVLSTINFLRNNKDVKLYVKPHPAELVDCVGTDRVNDLIKKRINVNEIDNLVLIPPEKKVDTYRFIKSGIDLGLIYDGFLGIELPFLKIPTITCVKGGFSSVEEGNITVSSKEEYFNFLRNIGEFIEMFNKNYEKSIRVLTKWLYWYIFENTITLPTLRYIKTDDGINLLRLRPKDLELEERLKNLFI